MTNFDSIQKDLSFLIEVIGADTQSIYDLDLVADYANQFMEESNYSAMISIVTFLIVSNEAAVEAFEIGIAGWKKVLLDLEKKIQ
jgi:hypothetical protein